ncbi:histidine phosphatase family protein [Nonomuraea rhodomycinica]|uniref:Histidine phosphatase family protein n=1 Tax=Nonomuraea rhodomycinica TaxID=1712872 RepID=A0A7Y6IJW4_9ACTN|nr:histidine phosphatase family protein [Nonomuraea rhodomycinica]NUW39396.1 histidine phosphatase family protein [Nonomuraea rhodomycinica]
MSTRHLYLARHGAADAFGELTDIGRRQAGLLGERLARVPVDAVWHSPLPRAAASARELARHLPDVPVAEAAELVDHVPYVPGAAETPPSWAGFFDGYDAAEAASGHRLAEALVARFAKVPGATPAGDRPDRHEVLVTHAYPVAWLVRHALDAPPSRWLGLNSGNTALTVIEYRDGLPPTIVMFNDMSHLPPDLRWTGFPAGTRP